MSLLTIFARPAQQTVSVALCSAAIIARTITISLAISPAYPTANTPAQHAIHRQLQNARAASLAIPLTIHPFKTATRIFRAATATATAHTVVMDTSLLLILHRLKSIKLVWPAAHHVFDAHQPISTIARSATKDFTYPTILVLCVQQDASSAHLQMSVSNVFLVIQAFCFHPCRAFTH